MKLSRYFFALVAIAIILVMAFSSCKKTVVNASTQPQPDVGTVWVGEPDTGYIQYALNLNLRLSAIFEYNGTQTADITNWINFLKRAQQKGVKLRICPIPIAPNGPAYMDDRHAAVQLGIVSSFIQLLQTNGVKPCQIILDIEGTNASKYCDSLVQFALGSTAARDTLVANALSVAGEDSAIALYQAFVDHMHSSGWKVGATTLNQIALERVGDNNIERVLRDTDHRCQLGLCDLSGISHPDLFSRCLAGCTQSYLMVCVPVCAIGADALWSKWRSGHWYHGYQCEWWML